MHQGSCSNEKQSMVLATIQETTPLLSSGTCTNHLKLPVFITNAGRLERLSEDDQGRTFELKAGAQHSLFNSTELRCIDIDMQCEGEPIQVVRRSGRGNAASIANDAARNARAKPKKYEIPTLSEGVILASLH